MLDLAVGLAEIAARTRPAQIIETLDGYAKRLGLRAYGAWKIPKRPQDYWRGYPIGKSMFVHPQVCAHYGEHIAAARQRGPNILARTAWVSDAPFTITECMRENRPTEMERWVIRLLRKFGIRDGLYCPVNGWVVFFWSPKVLRLTLRDRGCLNAAAVQASLRLDEIIPMPKHERPVRLSARELAVLHYLSIGASDAQIARDLAISEGAIRSYLVRAQKKLGVKTREHAIADAFRRKLIK